MSRGRLVGGPQPAVGMAGQPGAGPPILQGVCASLQVLLSPLSSSEGKLKHNQGCNRSKGMESQAVLGVYKQD